MLVKLGSLVVYVTSQPSSSSFCYFMLVSSSTKVEVEASKKETKRKETKEKKGEGRRVELDWNWKRDCLS